MEKKSFTALFAVIMLLLLVPFLPSYIESQFSSAESLITVSSAAAATTSLQQIKDYTANGYVGQYGYVPPLGVNEAQDSISAITNPVHFVPQDIT
jgi:hypothetical protein